MQRSSIAGYALLLGLACTAQESQPVPSDGLDPLAGATDSLAGSSIAGSSGADPAPADPGPGAGAAGSAGTTPPAGSGPSRAPVDAAGVRYAGGETTDFGNGSDDPCGTTQTVEAISREGAAALGVDVAAETAWLAEPHRAATSWNPARCADLGASCADNIELRFEVIDLSLLRRSYRRPGNGCPSGPTQHVAYRGAVHIQTDDGQLAGSFYARLNPLGLGETERERFATSAIPDLRNFTGSLPLRLDLARAHLAYLDTFLTLSQDGTTSGYLEPMVRYYDAARGAATLSADAGWSDVRGFANSPVPSGTATTLSDYPGSLLPPLVELSVRADIVDPGTNADVSMTVRIDDQVVRESSVLAGTSIELGAYPFGTRVSLDVRNPNVTERVRANILQDECFVASVDCTERDCTAHAEHTAGPSLCQQP